MKFPEVTVICAPDIGESGSPVENDDSSLLRMSPETAVITGNDSELVMRTLCVLLESVPNCGAIPRWVSSASI